MSDLDEVQMEAPGGKTKTSFDFDDAFSDTSGEDHEGSTFQLSPAIIREDLTKNLPITEGWLQPREDTEDFATRISFSADSISTINLDDHHSEILSPPAEYSQNIESPSQHSSSSTPGLSESDRNFSQISLDDLHERDQDGDPEETHTPHPYPTVHIDASEHHETQQGDQSPVLASLPEHPENASPQQSEPHTPNSAPPSRSWPPPQPISPQSLSPQPSSTPSTSNPSLSPVQKPSGHRPARSVGPSMLDKVVSRTRPPFLPPKSRDEDRKHMADWEAMMKHSRVAEEKRREALQERRLAREKKIEQSLGLWEKEIVPDWRVVQKNPQLRKLWWGGIPTKLRATMWERAVGNPLALSKDSYRTCLARAKRAITSGTFAAATLDLIEKDILSTLPSLHIFHPETGPLYQDLKDLLCAWVVARSDEGLGYMPGIAKVAGMFLINMPPPQGFVVMRNLLERHCLRSFYGGSAARDDVEAYYRIFDTLLADGMPKIYFNFKQHQISPAAYFPDWLIPLFLDHLPFEACARIWDVLLLEGDAFLYRAALAILAVLEPRLFFPDRRELLELLRGENKAALEVAKRDDRPLNGGKYEIYGVDEETLWERIESMEDWWKESTWTRLIQRELPDL